MNDIFEEVTRQMNSLKRQASKAERYAKLRDEMRAKLRLVLASKFAQLDRESIELDERDQFAVRRDAPPYRDGYSSSKQNKPSAPSVDMPSKPRSARTASV